MFHGQWVWSTVLSAVPRLAAVCGDRPPPPGALPLPPSPLLPPLSTLHHLPTLSPGQVQPSLSSPTVFSVCHPLQPATFLPAGQSANWTGQLLDGHSPHPSPSGTVCDGGVHVCTGDPVSRDAQIWHQTKTMTLVYYILSAAGL